MHSPIDFVAYPPTSFPLRDLLVLEQLDLGPTDNVCEIGVGSGATSARLARLCASVTGFDISAAALEALEYLGERHHNLALHVADATQPDSFVAFARSFSHVVSCDTLEHIDDPARYFETIHACLIPGGECLVTFPNEPPEKMHGITRFERAEDLIALATKAGLTDVRAGAVLLSQRANQLAERFGFAPVRAARELLRGKPQPGALKPQTFDQTDFHRHAPTWRKIAPLVNMYWWAVLRRMASQGPCFAIDWGFRSTDFRDCQVLLSAARDATDDDVRVSHTQLRAADASPLAATPPRAPASAML
jgi:SAM-dependent methyltransferase